VAYAATKLGGLTRDAHGTQKTRCAPLLTLPR
jgi:hypothetical protein